MVTGASRGLEVLALARTAADLHALAARTGCTPMVLDLTDRDAVRDALTGVEVDVLVNDAGVVTKVGPLHEADPADIDRLLALHVQAPIARAWRRRSTSTRRP